MSTMDLRKLTDRTEIIEVFNRYAAGVDQRDGELFLTCFVPDLEVDIEGVGPLPGGARDWVELALAAVGAYEVTQHFISNHDIQVEGDRATGEAYLLAQHWNPDSEYLLGGRYRNEFRRTDQGWRISRLGLEVAWSRQA